MGDLHPVRIELQAPVSRLGPDRGQGGETAVPAMKVHQLFDIDVADAVPVCAQKEVAVDVPLRPLDPASGHRVGTGCSKRHMEVLLHVLVVIRDLVALTELDGQVSLHRLVVEEVLLDHVALVAKTEDEVLEAMVRVELHDVPEQRISSNLDQAIRFELSLFSQPRPQTAAENDYLQVRAGQHRSRTASV